MQVDEDGIGCDESHTWFLISSLCIGLSERFIRAIHEAGGEGIELILLPV